MGWSPHHSQIFGLHVWQKEQEPLKGEFTSRENDATFLPLQKINRGQNFATRVFEQDWSSWYELSVVPLFGNRDEFTTNIWLKSASCNRARWLAIQHFL